MKHVISHMKSTPKLSHLNVTGMPNLWKIQEFGVTGQNELVSKFVITAEPG